MAEFQFQPIPFHQMLSGLGENIASGINRNRLRGAMEGVVGPDGTINYDRAISQLIQIDPVLGMKLATEREAARSLGDYRSGQLGLEYMQATKPRTALDPNSGGVVNLDTGQPVGEPEAPANPYAPRGKMTESQAKAATYVNRMSESHKVITDLENIMQKHPGEGVATWAFGPDATAPFVSPDMQKVLQAQRDFVNSVLRRESGAVIAAEEFANARQQYFPQPGDSPEVIAQKRQNRLNTMKGVSGEAGRNYQPPEFYDPRQASQPSLPPINPNVRRVTTVPIAPDGTEMRASAASPPPVATDMPEIPQTIGKVRRAMEMGHSPEAIEQALIADKVKPEVIRQIMQAIAQGPQ